MEDQITLCHTYIPLFYGQAGDRKLLLIMAQSNTMIYSFKASLSKEGIPAVLVLPAVTFLFAVCCKHRRWQ